MTLDVKFELLRHIKLNESCNITDLSRITGIHEQSIEQKLQILLENEEVYGSSQEKIVHITTEGETNFLRKYHEEFGDVKNLPHVQRWFMRFEGIQMKVDNVLANLVSIDTSDIKFDVLVGKLEAVISKVKTSLNELSSLIGHFNDYNTRIITALDMYDRYDNGRYLLGDQINSFKTVWMQLKREVDLLMHTNEPVKTNGGGR